MTAISGAAGAAPRNVLEHICRNCIEAQSLYGRRTPQIVTVEGASFGAALTETTPEDSADRQPLVSGPLLLVADARVDNRDELLRALGGGALTRGSPDSDILLAGWDRWKHGLFERLVGSYAIAVFDSESRNVTLARGPFADRPLCYRIADGCLRFASMPSGLVDGQFTPDLEALARFMALGDMALGETPFAGVRAVPPAHYLEWSPNGRRTARLWRPPAVERAIKGDVIEEFRALLDESVKCRLRRVAGPLATHLSAGLDSSGVTATAAAMLPDRRELIAFTMAPAAGAPLSVPRGYLADETALAAETARFLGIEQRVVAHSGPLLDCLEGHSKFYQAPVPNVPNHGWGHAIDREAEAAGARVLLSATQGNATISYGSIHLLSEWLRHGSLLHYFRQARALVHSGAARWRGALFYPAADFLPAALWNRLAGYPDESAPDLFIRREWMERVRNDKIGSDYEARGVRRDQYDIYSQSDPGMFTKGTLAKSGLDERDPGADRRLVEFCLRLPPEQYLDKGVTRRLAREGLSDRLPRAITDNNIRGYQGADWFAKLDPADALRWIERIEGSASARDIIDIHELRRAIERWDEIARLPPFRLRQWGNRFTRALAVGAFLRDADRDLGSFGRRDHALRIAPASASVAPAM